MAAINDVVFAYIPHIKKICDYVGFIVIDYIKTDFFTVLQKLRAGRTPTPDMKKPP